MFLTANTYHRKAEIDFLTSKLKILKEENERIDSIIQYKEDKENRENREDNYYDIYLAFFLIITLFIISFL